MLSETLMTELERYRIGARVRSLRLKKKLGLQQLSDHTGLSIAMLSKIERGQLFPTLPTLLRIALVFGIGLDHFFSSDRSPVTVVRADQRVRLPNAPGKDTPSYFFQSLDYPVPDRLMEGYYAEFPAGSAPSDPHAHGRAELVYVMKGELEITVGEEMVLLAEGDSASFDSSVPHRYCGKGGENCTALVVVSP